MSRRAAAERAATPASGGCEAGDRPAPTVPLSVLPPLVAASTFSDRKPVRLVKGLVRRLTAWSVDPVIDHVNVLQRALTRPNPGRDGHRDT